MKEDSKVVQIAEYAASHRARAAIGLTHSWLREQGYAPSASAELIVSAAFAVVADANGWPADELRGLARHCIDSMHLLEAKRRG